MVSDWILRAGAFDWKIWILRSLNVDRIAIPKRDFDTDFLITICSRHGLSDQA